MHSPKTQRLVLLNTALLKFIYVIILRTTGLVIRLKIVFTEQKNYLIDDLIICWDKKIFPLEFSFLPAQTDLAQASCSTIYAIVYDYVLRINNLPRIRSELPVNPQRQLNRVSNGRLFKCPIKGCEIPVDSLNVRVNESATISAYYRYTPSLPQFLISNHSRRKLETSLQRSRCSELDNIR